MVQSSAAHAAFPTADSTVPHGWLLGQIEFEIDRVFGPDVFQTIIVEAPSVEGLLAQQGGLIDDDARATNVTFRTLRLALFHFFLYAFPQESIPTIRKRFPHYAQMGPPSCLVSHFVDVVARRAGVGKMDEEGEWCKEQGVMVAMTKLLPVFYHAFAEMGADEALIASLIDKGQTAEGDPIHQPGFWDEDHGTVWNQRWGRFTDDARFMAVMARCLANVPKERSEYAVLMLMRIVTAREHLDLIEFEQIASIVAEECKGSVSSSVTLN